MAVDHTQRENVKIPLVGDDALDQVRILRVTPIKYEFFVIVVAAAAVELLSTVALLLNLVYHLAGFVFSLCTHQTEAKDTRRKQTKLSNQPER